MSTPPLSFATMPNGLLLMADGLNPMTRWDGFLASAQSAGLAAPLTAPTLGSPNSPGNYYAYCRFLDAQGNPSNLSAVSNLLSATDTTQGGLGGGTFADGAVSASPTSPLARLNLPGHGLQTNDYIWIASSGFVSGSGAGDLRGSWYVTVIDANTVDLQGSTYAAPNSGLGTHPWALLGVGATQVPGLAARVTRTTHNLSTGQAINVVALRAGTLAAGYVLPLAFTVTVQDANTFTLSGPSISGSGWSIAYVPPANTFNYTNVPVPTDAKVVRRQLLRNTNGQTTTFYVDVDTTDISGTSFSSSNTDATLQTKTAVPILRSDGSLNANRYDVPPSHKAYLAQHLSRMFAAGEVVYSAGNVQVTNGSTTVTGVGTAWPASFVGRYLYVRGATQAYLIDAVNTTAQTLTLHTAYADSTDLFASYGIRPAAAERRLIYWAEAGFPEAWPPTNAFSLQEDGDEITGLLQKGGYLYILERKHVYRFTFYNDPATDGQPFQVLQRGCINNRCWATVEDMTFLLDEAGIHAFGGAGAGSQPLGHLVQDLFRFSDSPYRVNWAAKDYFHCVTFPQQEVVRWFVVMEGQYLPKHALCLNYREKRFWIEQFSRPIGASTLGYLNGTPQVYLGTDAKKCLAMWQGTLDGPDPSAGSVRGTATAATLLSLSDSTANFPTSGVVGAPLVIVAGKGKGQVRRITAQTGTKLSVRDPWLTLPDTTSVYQIGGVVWQYRSGVFRYIEDEATTARRLELIFNPCPTAAATANLRLFENLSATPTIWAVTMDSASGQGVQSQAGSADLVVDLTKANGFVQRRLDRHRDPFSDGTRFASVELQGVTNADVVTIFQLQLDGAFA